MVEPGALVAGHRVERLLGDDAMGAQWRVSDPSGRPRVLRTLLVYLPAFQERFRRAAEVLVAAEHPNLVRVHEVLDLDGVPALFAEWVEGGNLADWIRRGPHPPSQIVPLLHGILSGAGAAHELGLLHRNLKPTKVLLDGGTVPKIDDFALGKVTLEEGDLKLTQVGTTFGTPQYMPPEQFRGASLVGPPGDLFAVGCLAYEMCTGARAFDGRDVVDIYAASGSGAYAPLAARRPDLPPPLVALIDDLLRPEPEERPQTAREAIDRLLTEPLLQALLPGLRPRTTKPPSRPPVVDERPRPAPPPPVAEAGDTPLSVDRAAASLQEATPPAVASRLAQVEADELRKRTLIVRVGAAVVLAMVVALVALLAAG